MTVLFNTFMLILSLINKNARKILEKKLFKTLNVLLEV